MFELILEGEHTIEKARNKVADCEQIENKLSKERTKTLERWSNREDSQNLTEKLRDAERATEIARIEGIYSFIIILRLVLPDKVSLSIYSSGTKGKRKQGYKTYSH